MSSKKNSYFYLPRKIRFTREGKYYFFITIGVGFAAVNTGNNLLYLLLGKLLGLIVVSGILSEICLRDLYVKRLIPSNVVAKSPSLIGFWIENRKSFFPSFSVLVEDCLEGVQGERKCFFLKISPQDEQSLSYRVVFPRRGQYFLEDIKISTQFPFSIFDKSRMYSIQEEIIVYPPLYQVYPPVFKTIVQALGEQNSNRRGEGLDFFMLREMQEGDEVRWIHWPSSAKTGHLLVKQFEEEHQGEIHIVLWNGLSEGQLYVEQDLDDCISLAASLLLRLVQEGHSVHFSTATRNYLPVLSKRDVMMMMKDLALLSFESVSESVSFPKGAVLVLPDDFPVPSLASSVRVLTPRSVQMSETPLQEKTTS